MTVPVIVERPDGVFVDDLAASDFIVAVPGVRNPAVTLVSPSGPLTLLLLVDSTLSMEVAYAQHDANASSAWLQARRRTEVIDAVDRDLVAGLRPGDRVRIGSIASKVWLGDRFTSDRNEIAQAAAKALNRDLVDRAGESPLWDATMESVALLSSESGYRAVLLLSDGMATGNRSRAEDAAAAAAAQGIPVHVMSVAFDEAIRQQGSSTGLLQRPSRGLRELADATGGLFQQSKYGKYPSNPLSSVNYENQINLWPVRRPGEAFRRVLAAIRATRLVTFTIDNADGGVHPIDLRLRRSGLTLRAPRWFKAPDQSLALSIE